MLKCNTIRTPFTKYAYAETASYTWDGNRSMRGYKTVDGYCALLPIVKRAKQPYSVRDLKTGMIISDDLILSDAKKIMARYKYAGRKVAVYHYDHKFMV